MKRYVCFLFWLVCSVIFSRSVFAQSFVGGRGQSLSVCQNGPATSIDALLGVDNPSVGVIQNWSVVTGPVHGSLVCSYAALTSGGIIVPTGQIYTPAPFYAGADSFKVRVSDGAAADTTTVYVTVNMLPSVITGSSRTCIGVCIPLSNATPGGLWSTSGSIASVGSATGVVCGIAAGGAVITYSLGTGCYATKVVTVTTAPDFTGPSGLCVGGSASLTGVFTGGSWLSGSPGIASVGSTSGIVSGVSAGTASITYTSSPGCSAVHPISVSPAPTPITGTNPVCVGLAASWINGVSGGLWSASNMAIATVGSITGIVTGISAGTTIITYSTGIGCYVSKTATVVSTPGAIGGSSSICVGNVFTFTNATPGGIWISSAPGIASVGSVSGVVGGVAAGTAVISYSLGGGCVATRSVTIHPSPAPLAGAGTICTGANEAFTTGVPGGVWSIGGTLVATVGSSSGIVTGVTAGVAVITYTSVAGCSATKSTTVYATPSAGILSGDSSVCIGDTVTFASTVSGGIWSLTNAHAGNAGGDIWGLVAGIDTVVYTVSSAYCSASALRAVRVLPLPDAGTITGSDSVCVGASSAFTSVIPGGVWSVVDTMATITSGGVATGVRPGTDTILYTVTTVCGVAVARHAITVNPLPNAGIIEGSSDACLGADITLIDTVSGGVWSAVNGNAAVAAGIVTGLHLGIDTILYTVTNGCGTAVATKTITINPLPFAGVVTTTRAGAICPGDTVSFHDTVSGGFWSTVTGSAMVGPDGLVSGVSGGIDTVVYSVFNVCGIATATHTIMVNPGPFAGAISGDGAVCAGSIIVLTNFVTGGTWISSNTVSATVDGVGLVTGIAPGTTDIYYVVTNGCGADTARQTVNIEIPVLPILGTSEVCPFGLATFIDPTPGGTWSSSNLLVAPVFGGFAIGITPGTTTISYTINNSCGTSVATFELRVKSAEECNPTAIETTAMATAGLRIFPNPNNGKFALTVSAAAIEEVQIVITNVAGAVINRYTTKTNAVLPVALIAPPGLYFIQAVTPSATYIDKLIVE